MRKSSILLLLVFSGCLPHVDDEPPEVAICIANKVDINTRQITSQVEFSEHGLVGFVEVVGRHSFRSRRNFYDKSKKLTWATYITEIAAEDAADSVAVDVSGEHHFTHDSAGRLARGTTKESTLRNGETSTWTRTVDRSYDPLGNKVYELSVFSMGGKQPSMARTYTYEGSLLKTISATSTDFLNKKHQYDVTFSHDSRGNTTGTHFVGSFESTSTMEYDDQNRLIQSGTQRIYDWNQEGKLIRNHPHKLNYEYDEVGMLIAGRFDQGGGFDMSYSSACPVGLAHPLVMPDSSNVINYEGSQTRYDYASSW